MEGAALRDARNHDLAMVLAWHTAAFSGGGAKNKRLSDFLIADRNAEPRSSSAQAIHFFHKLKARGVDVKIERVVH